jgi:hypothetical protein
MHATRTHRCHSCMPTTWVMPFGRYDRERLKRSWQALFDTPELDHNNRNSDPDRREIAQVDLCSEASPGTGRPILRQKAAKRGSSL